MNIILFYFILFYFLIYTFAYMQMLILKTRMHSYQKPK